MSDAFPGSTPAVLWIVGTIDEAIGGINLEFPRAERELPSTMPPKPPG
jgi:hypothetical protein